MHIIQRLWKGVSRSDVFRLYPIADVHLGADTCDEAAFRATVAAVAADDAGYWLDLGDKCEFINLSDKRFDPDSMAEWLSVKHLGDVAKAQMERYLEIVRPIAAKCLVTVEGNHEWAIHAKYERDVQSEITSQLKEWAGLPSDAPLSVGVTGWLVLTFRRSQKRQEHTTLIRTSLHHGFTGGKLAGAKALDMQRWLWTHEAELALMGHSHITASYMEACESVHGTEVRRDIRRGAICGSYLNGRGGASAAYADRKGYLPAGNGRVVIELRPGAEE